MQPKPVHLFVFDTLADWEPGFAIAGLNNPAFQKQPGRYHVRSVGINREPVRTIGGLTILPDLCLDDLTPEQSAMLILPGGECWDAGGNVEAIEVAARFLAAGVPVAAICGATASLARAGLLDQRAHTSNAREYLAMTGYQGGSLYCDERAVCDGDLITAGATAPIEFAYQIFKRLDIYAEEVLEGWYGLFSTGDPAYYARLVGSGARG